MKIEDGIKKYLEYIKKELNYSNMTINSYESDLKIFRDFLVLRNYNYLNMSKDIIMEYLKYLDNLKYQNKSISRMLSSIRSFYNYLEEVKVINNNIFLSIRNPKVSKKLPNYLSIVEIENILDSMKEDNNKDIRDKCLFELMYSTGLRVSEVSNIKIKDIDLKEKSIRVLGKGSKERIVYFGDVCLNYIDKYLNIRNEFIKNSDIEYLFINDNGEKLSRQSIEYIINKIMKKSLINHKMSPHTLRHTYATHLLDNGADLRSVQELLGHDNLNTTEVYTHVSKEYLRSEYLKYHPNNKRQ